MCLSKQWQLSGIKGDIKNMLISEIQALRTVLEDCTSDSEGWFNYYRNDILTLNRCRNGRKVAWCIWDENLQSCRYVDTLKRLSEKEIEDELL